MATTATLITELKLKAEKYNKALTSAYNRTKRFSASAIKTFSSIAKVATKSFAVIGAASSAAFILMSKKATESARELRAWSDTLGSSIATLQQWSFAAQSVGFSSEKLTDIFKDVNDKIGDFVLTGGGEAAAVLKEIGISAGEVAGLKAEDALIKIANATKQLSNQKRIFIFEAIANDASKLLPLLDNGGSKIKAMSALFKRLGLTLSESVVNKLVELGAKFREMGAILSSFASNIVAGLADPIINVINRLQELIIKYGGVEQIAKKVTDFIKDAFSSVWEVIASFINNTVNGFRHLMPEIQTFKDLVMGVGEEFEIAAAKWERFKAQGTLISSTAGEQVARLPRRVATLGGLLGSTESKASRDYLERSRQAQGRSLFATETINRLQQQRAIRDFRSGTAQSAPSPFDINALFPSLGRSTGTQSKTLIELTPEAKQLIRLKEQAQAGETSFSDTALNIERAARQESR